MLIKKLIQNFLIPILILIAVIGIPILVISLCVTHPEVKGRYIFTVFVFIVLIERVWETFYSTEEKRRHKLYGDWTLVLTTVLYLIMAAIAISEFFLIKREKNIIISVIAGIIFILAFLVRIWGIKKLGRQWAVHAVGASKVKKAELRLIKEGPYKYIRHPIYLATIFEVISLPLIVNCYYACLFALFINSPMYIVRAYSEERLSIRKFGQEYIKYKEEVPGFFPRIFR